MPSLSTVLSVTHHDPDCLHPGQLAAGGMASQPPPASQSALHPFLTDDMFLLDLLQKLVSLLALDSATFLTVFSPLAPPSKEAACTKLVSSEF